MQQINLIVQECRKKGVDCIVAPYEADAQLAYLMKASLAQAIISEDSDLLVYGCQKVRVLVLPSNAEVNSNYHGQWLIGV